MKRLLPALCAAVLLTTVGPLPSAQAGWWHHHSGPGPAGVGADKKDKQTKSHREHHTRENTTAIYNSPKSIGWWHKSPGPMGAGSGESGKTQTARREKHHKEKSAQRSTHHSLFAWLHRHNNNSTPAPATGK